MQAQTILVNIKVIFKSKELKSAQAALKALQNQLQLTQAAQMNMFQGVAQAAQNAAAALEMQSAAARRAAQSAVSAQQQTTRALGGMGAGTAPQITMGGGSLVADAMRALQGQSRELSRGTTGIFSNLRQSLSGINFEGAFQGFSRGVNVASSSIRRFGTVTKNTIKTLTLWNSIFGRITTAMLIWSGWRKVAEGFRAIADSIVGANMRMQSAEQMFTALSGGAEEMGGRYLQIIKQLSIETGTSVDKLVENAKRLPTQVGQNFEAFTELTRKAIVLGFLDPVQGVEGAMFALSNFMEGTAAGARSLVQRFELFNAGMVKRAFEQAANPVEALDILFKEANIDVDLMIEKLSNTLPVALQGLDSMFREFFRILGEPTMDKITEQIVKLRDFVKENQPQLQGFAQAFGEGLSNGFDRAWDFIADITGLDQFDPESWFDAGLELMINFSEGLLTAVTDFVIPAITSIAQLIGSFFIGASPPPMGPLSEIREGGENTIKAYIEGLVAGLSSDQIKAMAKNILDNVINLEAQELAQEKAIKQLEKWVDEASEAVDAKRREIKLFDLATEDIPERFTRARRRQLEYELLAAQDEEKRRKKALELAKEQLKATKEYLRTQERVLRALEAQAKVREKEEKEDEAKSELDKSFQDVEGIDTTKLEAEIEKWKKIFSDKLQPLFDVWKEGFGDIADFARGFIGVDPDKIRGITDMFLQGQAMRTGIDNIIDGITRLGQQIQNFLKILQEVDQNTPPWLKEIMKAVIGVIVFPKLSLAAGLVLTLEDPGNVKGLLLLIGGLFGIGGGPLLLGAGKGVVTVATKVLPLVFSIAFSGSVGLFGALMNVLGAFGIGAGGVAAGGVSALVLPLTLLLGLILWKGKDILKSYIDLEGTFAILALKGLDKVQENIDKAFGPLFKLLGMEGGTTDIVDFGALAGNVADALKGADETIAGWQQPWEKLWYEVLPGAVKAVAPDIDKASKETLYDPPYAWATQLDEDLVSRSIIPDMMRSIVDLYRNLPNQLRPHLETLYSVVIRTMEMISFEWQMEWAKMVMNTEFAMERIATGFIELSAMLQELTYMNQQLEYQAAQQAIAGTQATGSGLAAATASAMNVELRLDADETRRLWEEGTYDAITNTFSHNNRGLR